MKTQPYEVHGYSRSSPEKFIALQALVTKKTRKKPSKTKTTTKRTRERRTNKT